jgi:hypothetical protein
VGLDLSNCRESSSNAILAQWINRGSTRESRRHRYDWTLDKVKDKLDELFQRFQAGSVSF